MTGWRAGYALAAKPVIANLSKLQSQSTSNATSFVQKAAIAAVSGPQECVAEFRAEFIDLRDYMLAKLAQIPGVTCTKPEGAFYVYPNIAAFLGKGGIRTATELATGCCTKRTSSRSPARPSAPANTSASPIRSPRKPSTKEPNTMSQASRKKCRNSTQYARHHLGQPAPERGVQSGSRSSASSTMNPRSREEKPCSSSNTT